MTSDYTYNPDAWHPAIAGLVAGAIAAIVAGGLSVILRSPDEVVANSLTVVVGSLALGVVAGFLWRRLRATANARRTFGWTMAGGWFVAMLAITIADQTLLSNLVPYAAPLVAIIFITLGFLTPLLAGVTSPVWIAAIPVVVALAMGIGLFGRGNVASGELTLDSVSTTSQAPTTTVAANTSDDSSSDTTADQSTDTTQANNGDTGASSVDPETGLASSYTVASGIATYSVEETLQGLATVGVGSTEAVTGSIQPGEGFSFTMDLTSFTSDQNRRDSRVREWFQDNPEGTFSGGAFEFPAGTEPGEVVTFDITGTMTVNTIEQDTTWAIEARLEDNGSITVTGETFIVLSDFDVPVLTGGFVEMEDGATIEVAFVADPG